MNLPSPDSFAQYQERKLCLCALYACSTTSGIRTKKRGANVGGAPTSKHQIQYGGWADDLVPDNDVVGVRKKLVIAAKTLGLWAKDETDHVHIQGKAPG